MPEGTHFHDPYTLADLTPEFRAAAALPAAGAFDAAPTEIDTTGLDAVTLYITYERGAVGGAVDLRIDYSPYSADQAGIEDWFQQTIYDPGGVVAGADTTSNLQRELLSYGSTGAGAETFVYAIRLNGAVERMRIAAAESGVVGTPGDCHIVGRLM